MDKKWVFIEIILSIGGKQNARQTSSVNVLSSEFADFQQPISNKPMIFPMMTFVEHFASRLLACVAGGFKGWG
jgi:hypothetical protein